MPNLGSSFRLFGRQRKTSISAIVTRADGTVEDLGVIAEKVDNLLLGFAMKVARSRIGVIILCGIVIALLWGLGPYVAMTIAHHLDGVH